MHWIYKSKIKTRKNERKVKYCLYVLRNQASLETRKNAGARYVFKFWLCGLSHQKSSVVGSSSILETYKLSKKDDGYGIVEVEEMEDLPTNRTEEVTGKCMPRKKFFNTNVSLLCFQDFFMVIMCCKHVWECLNKHRESHLSQNVTHDHTITFGTR